MKNQLTAGTVGFIFAIPGYFILQVLIEVIARGLLIIL